MVVLCCESKQVFRPPFCHLMSTDLDEIRQRSIIARKTFVGSISPRSVPGQLQAKRKRLRFCYA